MKKLFCSLFVCAAIFLLLDNRYRLTAVFAQESAGEVKTSQTEARVERETDLRLAEQIQRVTNRSTDDLPESFASDGTVAIDLQDRFQNVMLSRIDEDGDLAAACITSLGEANAFLGRDLETGAPVSSARYRPDKMAKIAAAAAEYGISEQEYNFYENLIEKATTRQSNSLSSATITIVNGDGAGEGFNDATAKAPEGGNNGATLGEQRLNLFNFAASIWGAYLDSNAPIAVNAQFNPLTCSATTATLGSARATFIYRDFPNAPLANTWYPSALASKLYGSDISSTSDEISATFNSDMDAGSCLGGRTFYYGLDNAVVSGKTNLLVVLLHEMGHGLGFSSAVDGSTGQLAGNDTNGRYPDIFTRFIYDRTAGKYWYQMTDAERKASAFNTGNVLWDGANVKIASGFLTSGREASTGRVQLFAPDPYKAGGSVSHWDTACFPNLLMEPNVTAGLPLTLDLTRQEMRDIGWYRDTTNDLIPDTITNVQPSSGSNFAAGSSATVTWTNTGGFNRNVTVDISTDGGATYTVLASNIANTGSYTFTVPNTATTQARLRVREYDFVEPSGASASNFTIGSAPVASRRTAFDFDGDGKADVSVYRPSEGNWYISNSASGGALSVVRFGLANDKIVPADYDGDGKTDVAIYRPSEGNWYLLRSRDGFGGVHFGNPEDIPQPADFDGDGKSELAVYRPSSGIWYVFNLVNNNFTGVQFGNSTDKPVAADYDGDGRTDYAIYRPAEGNWYLQQSTAGFSVVRFGLANDKPVPADYDGDGKADEAIYRPEEGNWYLQRSKIGFGGAHFGAASDVAAPADYDGDGKTDLGIFRPAEGAWYQLNTQSGFQVVGFGVSTDKPVPNAFLP